MHTRYADVEVLDADASGALYAWRVVFDRDLEDPSLVWRRAEGAGFVPFTPPAIGVSVDVAPQLPLP